MVKDGSQTLSLVWLTGQEAIDLWMEGRKEWNKWVRKNPKANISFEDVDFAHLRKHFEDNVISFKSFKFPSGRVSFARTIFGDGQVNFSKTNFEDCEVSFYEANFGKGLTSFNEAVFKTGGKNFSRAIFDGNVSFTRTKFGDGLVSFKDAHFNNGKVSFYKAVFGEGKVIFIRANFNCEMITFIRSIVNKGDISFLKAKFNCKRVLFQGINVKNGDISFNSATFSQAHINFERSYFNGFVIFANLSGSEKILSFDLRHCTFEKTLDFSGNTFKIIPDLTCTKISHHVSLEEFTTEVQTKPYKHLLRHWLARLLVVLWGTRNLSTKYRTFYRLLPQTQWLSRQIVKDKRDVERVRRLKEIAETNKDHHKTIEFHVQEFKANRWIGPQKKSVLFTECLFDLFSDYGRSEKRPLISLIALWLLFCPIYAYSSAINQTNDKLSSAFTSALGDSLVYSFSQMLPLVPSSRSARSESATALFGGETPSWIYALTGTQSIMAFVLVFLLGLALRNRFRI